MNIKCTIIEDLLPLYVDGICSDDSKELIEVHLKECAECNQKYMDMAKEILPSESIAEEKEPPGGHKLEREELVNSFTAKKAFKKLRKRFIALIICILLLIPNIYLGINQIRGEGICYTNIPVAYKTYSMLSQIKRGNYEKAFDYLDIEGNYNRLIAPLNETRSLKDIYTIITIGDRDYYVTDQIFLNNYCQYMEDKDEINFWVDLYLLNDYIIPEEQYNQMLKENPNISESNFDEDYIDSGNRPELISSQYGNYYIPYHFKSSGGSLNDTELLNGLAGISDIIPVEAYQAALEQDMKYEEETKDMRLKYIAMGYESYYNTCKNNFIDSMERLAENGVSINGIKLRDISLTSNNRFDEYQLDYDLFFKVDGRTIKGLGVGIRANQGKINFNSAYSRIDSEVEELNDEYHITSSFLSFNMVEEN